MIRGREMTEKGRSDKLEVARITGVQSIRAAMARLADKEADVPLPTDEVDAPRARKT